MCLVALPQVVANTQRQRQRFLGDALGVVTDEAQSAMAAGAAGSPSGGSPVSSGPSAAGGSGAEARDLAADLQQFTQQMGAAAGRMGNGSEARASDADAAQRSVAAFAVATLGCCLLRSSAQASRDAAPAAAAAAPLTLADLLWPCQLRDIAAGQLAALPAACVSNAAAFQQLLRASEDMEFAAEDAMAAGGSLVLFAAFCLPEGCGIHCPAEPDEQLALALHCAEVCLSQHSMHHLHRPH